ncbi:hypothetical protein OVA29_00080 [Exiguobacterium sp. SL14]|nr:hypothetical protein [Exiguobacterium sp. SL14]MCY1689481.1 hypothetical protein [Exiguobacterium sp. SL14]
MKTVANFRKDFEEILEDPNTNRRDVRLANLMSEMEGAIQIPLPQNLEWEALSIRKRLNCTVRFRTLECSEITKKRHHCVK